MSTKRKLFTGANPFIEIIGLSPKSTKVFKDSLIEKLTNSKPKRKKKEVKK